MSRKKYFNENKKRAGVTECIVDASTIASTNDEMAWLFSQLSTGWLWTTSEQVVEQKDHIP